MIPAARPAHHAVEGLLSARAAILLLAALPATASAHDFWIQPDDFSPAPGVPVELRLVVGEDCEGEVVPRRPDRIESFRVVSRAGAAPVEGEEGREPAGVATMKEPGAHVAAYRSRRARVELEADEFDAYLASEGAEDIVAWRAENGQEDAPGREAYSRCCKALLMVGEPANATLPAPFGWPLELVPQGELADIVAGRELEVQLLASGKPLADRLVTAIYCDGTVADVQVHSDERGIARLALPQPGAWLIKAVLVVPAEPALRDEMDVDWESFWASLTLELPSAPLPKDAAAAPPESAVPAAQPLPPQPPAHAPAEGAPPRKTSP